MTRYTCAVCHIPFDANDPPRLTHPEDLARVNVSEEDAKRFYITVCKECLKDGSEE